MTSVGGDAGDLTVVAGTIPLILVAPHGGRRDPVRRPWTSGRLRVNDLHTAGLSLGLARAFGAAALVNGARDRNEVDLNRISETHERAPLFLERLADLLDAALARHARATVLVVHGWNVIQPVVDVGLGASPAADPFVVGASAAVSPTFAAGALRTLVGGCTARGVRATIGARYPARHRENLLQLFTPRYRDDPRPLVRALAARTVTVDAAQLELGIPLRWPGPWRRSFHEALAGALPLLLSPGATAPAPGSGALEPGARVPPLPRRLEFVGDGLSGLVGLDAAGGGRLLLFPREGGLALFTGERVGVEDPESVGGLVVRVVAGGLEVRFRGPLLRFPDTKPFLDLEPGLAAATLSDADVALDFGSEGGGEESASGFGRVRGTVALGATRVPIDAHGFAEVGPGPGVWPRLRAALRLGERGGLALTLPLDGGAANGFVWREGRRTTVATARAELGAPDAPLERVVLEIALEDGERLRLAARGVHRLPVIRGRGTTPVRLEFAACRIDDGPGAAPQLAGWCEVGGL